MLVDEYQDINLIQHRLIAQLLGPERSICVAGDDDQSIYQFRGAARESILNFANEFPDARVVTLSLDYGCSKEIIKLANAVIAKSAQR